MIYSPGNKLQVTVSLLIGLTVATPTIATTVFVDQTAAGANDGTSWTDAASR